MFVPSTANDDGADLDPGRMLSPLLEPRTIWVLDEQTVCIYDRNLLESVTMHS